jgi:TetR/AcrR family transcriptional repressor of nem operon
MKITKEQAAENRATLVRTAGRLFRERGFDGVGVAEISKAAGLTHGALYAHFPSKDALAAEALTQGLMRGYARLTKLTEAGEPTLADVLDFYLSAWQRDNLAAGCAMAASASEIARQDATISARFTDGFLLAVDAVERTLGDTGDAADRRQRALAIVAAMIGGVAVARATAKSSPQLSDEVLTAARRVLGDVGGAAVAPRARARRQRRAVKRDGQ